MSRCFSHLAGVLFLMIPTLVAAQGDAGKSADDDAAVIERLSAAVRHEVGQKLLPAFSIAVVDGERVVWAEGFGFQDAAKKIPATADTIYRVGSVSKLFTDMAIMQQVEQGELDLDLPVTKYLPGFRPQNPFETPITLRQLMSHRSGLVRESPVGHYFDPTEPTLAATVDSLNATTLVYPPTTRTKYSNAGIAVLGEVLEKQLGKSYSQQIDATLLKPIGMNQSSFVLTPEVESRLAAGWMWTYDGQRFIAPKFAIGTAPAGNMYSSVRDLSLFLSCLYRDGKTNTGAILKPETLRMMTTPLPDVDGRPQGFGLGFHVQSLDGHTKIGHGGAVYGFATQVEALPEKKLGVAAVAALDGSNGVVARLANYALRLMLAQKEGKPLPAYPVTQPVPAERVREFVGDFRLDPQVLKVTALAGRLYLHDGTFRYEVRASADDGTIITDDVEGFGAKVALNDAGGLSFGGRDFARLPDVPPADCPEELRGLVGEYGWDHNVLYIHEERGQLWALIEWFYDYPLTRLSENLFAFPDYGLYHGEKLVFTRDSHGSGTRVVAAEVEFVRRETGTRDGETFRITPLRPIDELRSAALSAVPPVEAGDFHESELVELTSLDPTIRLDIRYASTDNFTGAVFYKQPRAFLQRPAAEAVVRAHRRLKERGLGLLIHDGYRPWHVTKMFWEATPPALRHFVANPANGSRHNRGCAVDLTLYDLATGEPIPMVSGYDEFSTRAYPMYPGGTSRQQWHRDLLRRTMEAEGFAVYEFEWWHFDHSDWKSYRIGNRTFQELGEP
ncbi:MAG: serine hydrolase [Planctomycetota bacterium]|nr:serine hydrolase [Planctomycetota bacterium]